MNTLYKKERKPIFGVTLCFLLCLLLCPNATVWGVPTDSSIHQVHGDSVYLIKLMTYNLKGRHTEYKIHAQVVKNADPDVVAVQEVRGLNKFEILKEKSGYKGIRFCTVVDYGIGLLYKSSSVGEPLQVKKILVDTYDKWYEIFRGFIVAEFRDFCFVATHYSQKEEGKKKMTREILKNSLVRKCINEGKPVYLAGDMNTKPDEPGIQGLKEAGFEVLNNTDKIGSNYVDATRRSGAMIDLILGYNTNPNHKTIEKYIPIPESERAAFFDNISDHLPYFVKVKFK